MKGLQRAKQSNLLSDNQISKNLTSMSKLRPDIFSISAAESEKLLSSQIQNSRKKEELIWDGHAVSASVVEKKATNAVTFEEQVEIYREQLREEMKIGPKGGEMDEITKMLLGEDPLSSVPTLPISSGEKVCFSSMIFFTHLLDIRDHSLMPINLQKG